MISETTRHVIVTGRVQGVGYRAWVADEAAMRGLGGWVRNRRDGSVEAVFAGGEPDVATMIAACRRGPSMAHVEAVVASNASEDLLAQRGDQTFAVLSTL